MPRFNLIIKCKNMDIISQFENEDKYYLKKFEEIINPSIKIEKDINIKDADDCFNAVVKLLEVYLFPVFIGLIYLNITKYITYKFILLKPYCECLSNLKKKFIKTNELDMEVVFNCLCELPRNCQKDIIGVEKIDDLIKIQIFECVKKNNYEQFYRILVDNKINISEFLKPIQTIILLEDMIRVLRYNNTTNGYNYAEKFSNKHGIGNITEDFNEKEVLSLLLQMVYDTYTAIEEVISKNILSQSELDLIESKFDDHFIKSAFKNIETDIIILKHSDYLLSIDYSESEKEILKSNDLDRMNNLLKDKINKRDTIIQVFTLPDNYFELEPEKDESLYLGAKDSAIITTEGVESFIKLINFIVDNNYVKAGEEHSTLNDLKYDLAFKLTGKMRPNILCPKIIWTNSDYTNPLIAIAKGLGGNYDKLKDLFIIDSSYHNRLASIYAERLHIGDKFTNFFYELYPKMNNKVKKVKKNNKAD